MQNNLERALAHFTLEDWIDGVATPVKSGKEASVWRCRAHSGHGGGLFALKVYHERERRNFKHNARYREGRFIPDERARRALARGSVFGRSVGEFLWQGWEYGCLKEFHDAGLAVPAPRASGPAAILMDWIGTAEVAAPRLKDVRITKIEAEAARSSLHEIVAGMLRLHRVHGDLSAFNVLWHENRPVVIDFPQVVDARTNGHAFSLLTRDLMNLDRYFERFGAGGNPEEESQQLWQLYQLGWL